MPRKVTGPKVFVNENVKRNQVEIQLHRASGSVGYFDYNFPAPVRRAFEHLVSLARLIEPQDFADFGLEPPALIIRRSLSTAPSLPELGRIPLAPHSPRLSLWTAVPPRRQRCRRVKNPIRAVQGFAAHRIEHRVNLLHPFFEPPYPIINDSIGAESAHVRIVFNRCGGDHHRPGPLGKLHRIAADIARPAMDEHGLSDDSWAKSKTICHAVTATTGTEAACVWLRRFGLGASIAALATA